MPVTLADHPSPELLAAYGAGKLDDDQSAEVESHLAECLHCAEVVCELPHDTIVRLLREGKTKSEPITAPTVVVGKDGQATDAAARLEATVVPQADVTEASLDEPGMGLEIPAELADHPRYEILERLGEGGMGQVFKARHKFMNRVIALKIISRKLTSNPQAIERFRREVHAAASLSHSNIVTAHDAEQAGDLHFLAMEYVDGTDLEQLVQQQGPLPVGQACDYIRQAAEGLQHAHEAGMVHRDIKPHNIMVESRGSRVESKEKHSPPSTIYPPLSVKILDFGLASLTAELLEEDLTDAADGEAEPTSARLTVSGTMMGTPDYIAPEQGRDAATADIRSDIYGLGCTLYYLLTGRPPFAKGSVLEKLKAHAEQEPQPLEELRDDVPAEVAATVRKMMAKDPGERYQSPSKVAEALSAVRWASKPVQERATDGFGKPSYRRRRPLALTAVATLCLASIVAAVVFYIQINHGTVRVEVLDDTLKVELAEETITVKDGKKVLTLRPGPKQIVVRQSGSDFELVTEMFELRRRGEVAMRVEVLDGEVIVIKDGKPFGAKALPAGPPQPNEPTDFYRALDEARLAWLVRTIAEDEKDGKIVGGSDSNPPYSLRHVSQIDDIDARIIFHVYNRLRELARSHGLTVGGERARELELKSFKYSNSTREGEVVLTLASRDAADVELVDARKVTLTVTVDEWAKGEDPPEIRERVWPQGPQARTAELSVVRVYDGHLFGSEGKLALSPDEKLFATFGTDGVRIWDVNSGEQRNVVPVRNATSVVFLKHDPRLIAVGTSEVGRSRETAGRVLLWNVEFNQLHRELTPIRGEVHALDHSPDGRELAVGAHVQNSGEAFLWNLETSEKRALVDNEPVSSIRFTPNGRFVVTATADERGTVRLFDVRNAKPIGMSEEVMNPGHFIRTLAVSPNAGCLAVAGGNWREKVGEVALLELPDLRLQARIARGTSEVRGLAFSPDGRLLALGSGDGKIFLLDAVTTNDVARFTAIQMEQAQLARTTPIVSDLAFTSDGRYLLSAAGRESGKLLQLPEIVWPENRPKPQPAVTTPERLQPTGHLDGHIKRVTGLAWHPDGKRAVSISGEDGQVRMWNITTGKTLWMNREGGAKDGVGSVAVSPDGHNVAVGDAQGFVHLHSAETGSGGMSAQDFRNPVAAVTFSPNGQWLAAAGSVEGPVKVWPWKDNTRPNADAAEEPKASGDAKPQPPGPDADGGEVTDTSDVLPNNSRGKLVEGTSTGAQALAFTPNGQTLLAGGRTFTSSVVKQDRKAGGLLGPFLNQKQNTRFEAVSSASWQAANAFSIATAPDGKMAAVGFSTGQIRLFEANHRLAFSQERFELNQLHQGPVTGLVFTADGRHLISAGMPAEDDGAKDSHASLVVWDVAALKPILEERSQSRIFHRLALSPDGRILLTAGGSASDDDFRIHIWRLPESVWPQAVESADDVTEKAD